MTISRISTGYVPRTFQAELHKKLTRFSVLVCHRRFGKTVFCVNHMIDSGLRCTKPHPRFAYLAPLYGQVKRVAWDYLKQYTQNIPGVKVNEADLRVDIPRPTGDTCRFSLLGADNPDSLRGIYLDGGILDEFAQMHPATWKEVIRPSLSDRQGWAVFIGTPKGRNAFYDLYNHATKQMESGSKDWLSSLYKASETKIISLAELESARQTMDESEYNQEFECDWGAANIGSYYGKIIEKLEKDGRISNVPYDPAIPVTTYWDLGVSDTTVIWFCQRVGQEIRLIDYLEDAGLGIPDYVKKLKEKGYLYDEDVLPHDAAARELGTGRSREETLRGLGRRTRIVPRQSIEDGINATRLVLARCWFDKSKCGRGIEALKEYSRKWDPKNQMFLSTPLHNWASNGADAFRQLAMGLRETGYRDQPLPRQALMDYDIF